MSFARPTLEELLDQAETQLASRMGLPALLPRGRLKGLAGMVAGLAHSLHGHVAWAARQVVPQTSDREQLDRWANADGVQRRAAQFAAGSIELTGDDGAQIPAGTTLQRSDGWEFTTQAAGTIAAGVASVDVLAVTAGADGNTTTGDLLSLTSPLSGIDDTATVESPGLSGGADQESDTALLERLLYARTYPPTGGSATQFVQWVMEVPGVLDAWALEAHGGLGNVGVTFLMDDGSTFGAAPDAAELATVEAYLLDGRKPVGCSLDVFAPALLDLDPQLSITPDNGVTRAAVQAELEDYIRRTREPGATHYLSMIRQAIGLAAGVTDFTLTSPAANVTTAAGELLTLGTITWS